MRSFMMSAIVVGIAATAATAAAAAPQSTQTASSEILKAAARALVMPMIAPPSTQLASPQAKGGSTEQAELYAVVAAASPNPKSCGSKNPAPPPKCPHPVSPH